MLEPNNYELKSVKKAKKMTAIAAAISITVGAPMYIYAYANRGNTNILGLLIIFALLLGILSCLLRVNLKYINNVEHRVYYFIIKALSIFTLVGTVCTLIAVAFFPK